MTTRETSCFAYRYIQQEEKRKSDSGTQRYFLIFCAVSCGAIFFLLKCDVTNIFNSQFKAFFATVD
jgi:hypothetical protein